MVAFHGCWRARGEIVSDDRGRTPMPHLVAADGAATVPHQPIVIAMGERSMAA